MKFPGPVSFLLIMTFITFPKTSKVGPDNSFGNLSSYFSFSSFLCNI